jgi:hypothetical protein
VKIKIWDLGGQVHGGARVLWRGPLCLFTALNCRSSSAACGSATAAACLASCKRGHPESCLPACFAPTLDRSFVVDASDERLLPIAKKVSARTLSVLYRRRALSASRACQELHELVSKASVSRIPLLVLMNKNDVENAVPPDTIAQTLCVRPLASWRCAARAADSCSACLCVSACCSDLQAIEDREVVYYSVSCKSQHNIDVTMDYLIKKAKK